MTDIGIGPDRLSLGMMFFMERPQQAFVKEDMGQIEPNVITEDGKEYG
jgi:hypothetical protein